MILLTGSAAAQSLGEVAAKEKKRREAQAAAASAKPSKAFTDADLQKYVGERPVETTEGEGSASRSPNVSDPNGATYSKPTLSLDQRAQQLRGLDDQIQACKARVTAAQAALRKAEQDPEIAPPRFAPRSLQDLKAEIARQRELARANVSSLRARIENTQRECAAMEETERTMRR